MAVPKVRVGLLALALLVAVVPIPPDVVERNYSRGFFPSLQATVTGLSNAVPIALLDPLIVLVVLAWLVMLLSDFMGGRSVVGRALGRTIVWGAALYLVFVAMWGLNYRRVRLADKVEQTADAATPDAVRTLASDAVDRVNEFYAGAHPPRFSYSSSRSGQPEEEDGQNLKASFTDLQRELGMKALTVPGRPKETLLDPYLRAAGVQGFTDPFFLETLINGDLLPVERPFVIAHEWSHLAGFADEGEANFLGWLTCVRAASPAVRYSGWLFLYEEVLAALPPEAREGVASRLGKGPRSDLALIAERLRTQVQPAVAMTGWKIYDRYLKTNHIEAGTQSYGEVVQLVLGTRFDKDWTVKLR